MRTPRRRSVAREFQSIRRSLASIVRALARLAPALEAAGRDPANPPARGRKRRLSARRRAALKLQGQYMGYSRNLGARQKARVKALRATKGVRAAISLAKELARR